HRVLLLSPRAASAGPGSPPPRDAGSRSTSLAQRDGDGLLPLLNLASRARAEGPVLVLAHHLADLPAPLRGTPARPPRRALPRHEWPLDRVLVGLTCWPSGRSARSSPTSRPTPSAPARKPW